MQEFTVGLCAAGIGCAIVEHLTPNGSLRRVLSVLTAVFFFGCFLSPLSSLVQTLGQWVTEVETETAVSAELEEAVEQQVISVLDEAMTADANNRLAERQITVKLVRIKRDIDRTDSIYIDHAEVVFKKEHFPISSEIRGLLEKAWGVPVEVYYADG